MGYEEARDRNKVGGSWEPHIVMSGGRKISRPTLHLREKGKWDWVVTARGLEVRKDEAGSIKTGQGRV